MSHSRPVCTTPPQQALPPPQSCSSSLSPEQTSSTKMPDSLSESWLTPGQQPSTREANLARIRDNQRRSRARRKEYMKECEEKVRKYEQAGVEASKEIQNAARKVLEENKRLREMLRGRGVGDAEMDRFLQASDPGDTSPTSASAALDALLQPRLPMAPELYARPRMNSAPSGPMLLRRPSAATMIHPQQSIPNQHQPLSFHIQPNSTLQLSPPQTSPTSIPITSISSANLVPATSSYDAHITQAMSQPMNQSIPYFTPDAWSSYNFDSSGVDDMERDVGDMQAASTLQGISTPNVSNGTINYSLSQDFQHIAINNGFARTPQLLTTQ